MVNKTSIKNSLNTNLSITNKEKKLLIILLLIIFLWVINKFVLTTQADEIEEIKQRKIDYEAELNKIEDILMKEDEVNKQYDILMKQMDDLQAKYFSNIDQPSIMHVLNELIDETNLDISNLSFAGPNLAELRDNNTTEYLTVTMPYNGSYTDLISFLTNIHNSSRKLLIRSFSLSKNEEDILNGQIEIDIYSFNEEYESYDYQVEPQITAKENPFEVFDGYVEKKNETDDENKYAYNSNSLNQTNKKTVLEDFERKDVYFMPSSPSVTGRLSQLSNSKHGEFSLRMEYFISTYEKEERAYVALDEKNIDIKYPPPSTGLWIHSYSYSPVTIGLRFKNQEGEKIDVKLTEGVNWIGWKYLEATPPQDVSLYPLKLDRIYVQLAANRDEYGVFLFDNLDITNPMSDNGNLEEQEKNNYYLYVVQSGDTIESISESMYGTESRIEDIISENGLESISLEIGQVLVIKK